MIDVLHPPRPPVEPTTASASLRSPGLRSPLGLRLREVAEDMAGHVDRDELTRDEESLLADSLDDAVAAAMPRIVELLDAELTPRMEALPVHARLTLAGARRRRSLGLD